MRSLVLSFALAVCAIALFSTVNAQSGVDVVTLSFNVTATWNSNQDDQVRPYIIQSIRQIAIGDPDSDTNPGAGIDEKDVKIDENDVQRLTDYQQPDPTQNWYTATWYFKLGFTGQNVPGLEPSNGAKSEETQFIFQAFNEAAAFNLTLRSLQTQTQTAQANVEDVQVVTGAATFAIQTNTITQAREIMTTHTCDDGTNIAATQACPITQAGVTSSSSSSTRIGVLIGSIVGAVVVLFIVIAAVVMVIRRHAANVKAMNRMPAQQEMTTQV